jgi:uncharacterized protein (TIGR03000 family)
MRGFAWAMALSAAAVLLGSGDSWAKGGRCGGGRHGGGCGSGGCSSGGCGGGGHSGGCGGSSCYTGGCAGGVCTAPTGGTKTTAAEGSVTLVVTLPADAKLSIDGYQTTSTSGQRTFVSPALKTGLDYSYTLKAEVVRNGETQSVTQLVKVRAGEETRVTLAMPTNAVASR